MANFKPSLIAICLYSSNLFVLLLYAIQWINLYVVLDWDNAYWMIYMNPFVRSLEYVMGMGVGRYVSSTYEERTKKGKNKNVILKVRGGMHSSFSTPLLMRTIYASPCSSNCTLDISFALKYFYCFCRRWSNY